jgi:translocation and assembly module TamB
MRKALLAIPLVLILSGIVFILNTASGLRALLRTAEILSQRSFSIQGVEGRLISAWKLKDLKIATAGADITVGELSVSWLPEKLADPTLHIAGLTAQGVVISLKEGGTEEVEKTAAPAVLPATLLPFPLVIGRLDIAGLQVIDAKGELLTDIRRVGLSIGGDRSRLEIHDGLIEAGLYGMSLHGVINAGTDWSTDLMGSWRITPNGGYAEMTGTFSARGPVSHLQVEAAANKPADVRVSGTLYDLPGWPHWQAQASGRQVWFPIFDPSWPDLLLDAEIEAAGDFSVYHGTVEARGSFLGFQDISGSAVVHGDGRGLTSRTLQLASPDGKVNVSNLILAWWDGFSWHGEVLTESFNPAGFDERFVGILTADIVSDGHLGYEDEDHLETTTDIRSLEGTVRDFPVTGKGRIFSQAEQLKLEEVFIESGASSLQAAGTIAADYDLQFVLASPDIGEILPGGEGEINASGRIGGSRDYPSLNLDLDAAGVRFADNIIERLTGTVHADTRPGAEMTATISGEQIAWSGLVLHNGEVRLDGSTEDHKFTARLQTDQGDLRFDLHGGLEEKQWQGRLQDMRLAQPSLGDWRQSEAADLGISAAGADLGGLCLERGQGRICLDAGWHKEEGKALWQLAGEMKDLPLAIFSDQGIIPWPVEGMLAASLTATGDAERVLTGELSVSVPRSSIEPGLAEEGFEELLLSETTLDLHLADQRLDADLSSVFQDRSSILLQVAIEEDGTFTAPIWRQPLTGQLRIDMQDLSPFGPLSGYMLRPTGSLNSSLAITGTLRRPVFEGRLDLRKGRIALPSLGIFLEDVGISLAAAGEQVRITGSSRSGPGRVDAEGILAYNEVTGLEGDFMVTGKDFEAVSLPEYEIRVDPDLRFRFTGEKGEVTGKLAIPHALITPEEMKDSVSVSKDVIYIDTKEEEMARHWPLDSQIEVTLGEDVRFDGYGLKGKLHGTLAIRDTSDTFMSGRGELSMEEGIFSLYGRNLAIERGRILFGGGPVDNPGIDARALQLIKEKSARKGDLVIGVDVSGTLQDLEFKLFSDPRMDEGDILAYMVVGHSMSDTNKEEGGILQAAASTIGLGEGVGMVTTLTGLLPVDEMHLAGTEEEGNMSLVVGKKLTDRLYLSYDHNFFDQKGAFRLSYDLGYGFSAETSSSAESNGADLFYSIER